MTERPMKARAGGIVVWAVEGRPLERKRKLGACPMTVFAADPTIGWLTVLSIACFLVAAGSGAVALERDGPMARISPELRALYDAYLAAQRRGLPFSSSDPLIPIVDDRVIVDAVASGDVYTLERDLRALGM